MRSLDFYEVHRFGGPTPAWLRQVREGAERVSGQNGLRGRLNICVLTRAASSCRFAAWQSASQRTAESSWRDSCEQTESTGLSSLRQRRRISGRLRRLPIATNPPTHFNGMPSLNAKLCPHSVHRYATSRETGDSIDIIQAEGLRSVDQPVTAGWAVVVS